MRAKKEDIFFVLFCVITAIIFASYRSVNGDFVAYNGDFQNYNIFRRLIAGQVQYKDFVNYLGNGMVFINLPLVYLFGTFGDSVFITNFTTSVLYSLILYISLYTVLQDRKKAYVISGMMAIASFIVLHMGFHGTFYYNYIYNVVYMGELGHSMRTTRAFLPFMLVGIIYIVKTKIKCDSLLIDIFQTCRLRIAVYFVLGMLTVWSNDYGYSCVVCIFVIMLLVNLFGRSVFPVRALAICKPLLACVTAMISTIAGMLSSVAIITHGNIMEYFSITLGISQYQFWYYGNHYDKYLTFSDIFSDRKYVFLTVVFFLHAVFFLVQVILDQINDDKICRLFLHSTCYCASLVYVVGSGAHNYASLELVNYILIFGLLGKIILSKIRLSYTAAILKKNQFSFYLVAMLLMYCISINIIRKNISYENKEAIAGLNTYSTIGAGLDQCAADIGDETIFSTYAGALETVNGVFQPTGTDYIIHVLGDKQRDEYIDNFVQGEYKYASTLKNEYTIWEYWSSRVNWYFYRELYLRYRPVKETNYSIIWERSDRENVLETDVDLKWEYINNSTCKIDIALPDYEEGAYVDLEIKYRTVWTQDRLRKGGMRKVLCVQDGGEQYNGYGSNSCYYLKENTNSSFIPIYVRNGRGYAYISSYPISCTKLEGVEISVKNVLRAPDFPLHVTNYTDDHRSISTDSVAQNGTLLKFDHTESAATILENAGQIRANGETGIVNDVWKDGNYIYVSLENTIRRDNFIYPNKITVEKRKKIYTAQNQSDNEWVCGVSRKEGKLLIDADIDIENLYAVRAGSVVKKVVAADQVEGGWCLSLEDNVGIQVFAYPQEIELIYE